ncbi:hypothetical protein NST08_24585 [Paenibacillus sp. FSL K6-1566]|uniref:hypothetical protein n=1 Tax=Paenibacillus sp. FSL K6-1566 TaxID=2954515 RepID=UPI003100B39B
MTIKLPTAVRTAVNAYTTESTKHETLIQSHRDVLDKLDADLRKTKADLASATQATIANPTADKIEAEAQYARKVKELEGDIVAAQERLQAARSAHSAQLGKLADEAINIGRDEAVRYFNEQRDTKLKAIEDAKHAYLAALVDLHTLRTEAYEIYRTAVNETNPARANRLESPNFTELTPFYRGGRQLHGVSESEIIRAYKYGRIEPTSVADGREITN